MKRLLIEVAAVIIFIAVIVILLLLWRHEHREKVREKQNVEALTDQAVYFRLKDSTQAASIGALNLTLSELKSATTGQLLDLKEKIAAMDVRLKDIRNASSANLETSTVLNTFLRDSVVMDTIPIKYFRQSTKFNDIDLTVWPLFQDSINLRVVTRDKITQVVYRERRGVKFWTDAFWNKRKIRQVISVENPDTKISYPQYIELKRNNK